MIYFPSFNERSYKRAHRFTSPFIYPHTVVSYFALFGIIVVEHDQYLLRIIEWTASYRYFWKSFEIEIHHSNRHKKEDSKTKSRWNALQLEEKKRLTRGSG